MKLPEINPNQPIAIDLETCDPELKYTVPGYVCNVGFVAGIAIRAEEGSWYIPIQHSKGYNYNKEDVVKWLNKTLSGDTEKIFHNAQYDLGWLKHIGVQVFGNIFDTMLAAPLLNENRFSYQLDSLGKIYCNEGKFEEALKMAVAEEFNKKKTHKTLIRLKEKSPCHDYKPFYESKLRSSQFYELWPKEVQDRYEVVGYEKSKTGQELFLVPTKRMADIKALLWACDPEEMGTYPIQDVDLTYKLYKIFKKQIDEENLTKLMHLENELVMPLLEMRTKGVRIDMLKAKELDIRYTAELEKLQNKLNTIAGFAVDVNINDDLIKICDKFNLKYSVTEKGNPCFSAEMVPKDDLGLFQTVLDIRKYKKARDTYVRGYLFGSTIDGWLHGQYNQLKSDDSGTVTGRLSSSGPNMQNMPNPKYSQIGRDIRGCFLPDNEEEKWLSMDYSGQEPKMLVHTVLMLDKALRKISRYDDAADKEFVPGAKLAATPEFRGREADFHSAVSKICMITEYKLEGKSNLIDTEVFNKAVKEFRPKAKSIGLGVMYGSGDDKVAEEMTKKGCPMTREEASSIRARIYEGVPFLNYINKILMEKAKRRGWIITILGRRGHFDKWECPVFDKKQKAKIASENLFDNREEALVWYKEHKDEYNIGMPSRAFAYKALNKYIQGSSADQTKAAMLHLYKRNNMDLKALDIFYRRIDGFTPPNFKTQVHDELNISFKKNEDVNWYQHVMETCIPLEVEVVADPVLCNNWSEAK